jgi:hypothetical protein
LAGFFQIAAAALNAIQIAELLPPHRAAVAAVRK